MNGLKIVFSKLEKYLVEGYFLRRCREEIDEWIGQIARFILLHTTEVRSNKIFFHTQENRYCCNPKYICEEFRKRKINVDMVCLLYTSDAADDLLCVELGSRRIIKKKNRRERIRRR